jgi:hypothetical protein
MENKIYEIFQNDYQYIESDWNVKFRNETLRLLKEKNVINEDINDLENLHQHVNDKYLINYDFNSGVNGITRALYDVDNKFLDLYKEYLKGLYDKLGFDFYFQECPTIRVHCPNAAFQHHYPRYHSDCFYGHPPQEINIWFSLTENNHSGFYLMDSNISKNWLNEMNNNVDLFIEKAINDVDFNKKGDSLSFEVEASLNKMFLFDSLCIHTNQPRTTDSRVSIDVRINPVDRFVDGYVGKGRMKAEFRPGGNFGYYKTSIKNL